MGALRNEKYERFAQLVAEGMMKSKAYAKVYPTAGIGRAHSGGPDLAGRPNIAERIAELQEAAAEEMRQALRVKLKLLKEVALTRYDEVDEESAAVRSVHQNCHGVMYTLWDRVSAVKMYSKLAGDLEPKAAVTVTPLGALIAKIRAGNSKRGTEEL